MQMALLAGWLRREAVPVSICRRKSPDLPAPMAASLLRAADLHECIDTEIVPLLRAGRFVCADGYLAMAAAENAARGLSRKWVRNLFRRAVVPDLGFYFRLPLGAALRQPRPPVSAYPALSGNADENFRLYQGRLIEEMDRLAAEMEFHVVDATRPPEDQQGELRRVVRQLSLTKENAPTA